MTDFTYNDDQHADVAGWCINNDAATCKVIAECIVENEGLTFVEATGNGDTDVEVAVWQIAYDTAHEILEALGGEYDPDMEDEDDLRELKIEDGEPIALDDAE